MDDSAMELPKFRTIQIPFTLYDFFGYLLPGIVFAATTLLSFDVPNALDWLTKRITHSGQPTSYSFLFRDFIGLLHESPWFISVFCLLVAYILGHFIAALSSYFFERLLVQGWLGYPTTNMFQLGGSKKVWFFRNFRRAYSSEFVSEFKSQFESQFKIPLSNSNDIFWITWSFVAHNCPSAFARSTHFLNLYGFSRNLSMTFLIAGFFLISFDVLNGLPPHWFFFVLYFVVALILYWNYLKLLRRLNDEVYRGFYSFVMTNTDVK